ncbi:MAG: hypothetical protein AABW83_02990 [Nanoarchaeota archaeon]
MQIDIKSIIILRENEFISKYFPEHYQNYEDGIIENLRNNRDYILDFLERKIKYDKHIVED